MPSDLCLWHLENYASVVGAKKIQWTSESLMFVGQTVCATHHADLISANPQDKSVR